MPATIPRRRRDAGQAFPLYIVAVAGLLFLALAFFAVGQAATTRNGAQTAADAAALAAGQQYRDLLTKTFFDGLRDGSYQSNRAVWKDLLNGRGVSSDTACERAGWFAGRNGADLSGTRTGSGSGCVAGSWPTSFAVAVKTRNPVGNSVIPMTKSAYGEAKAKSVVKPRCTLDPATDGPGGTGATGGTGKTDGKSGEGGKDGKDGKGGKDKDAPKATPLEITCDGKRWTLDPDDLRHLPDASDLFSVRLAQ
ncbi:pilus assembly protein TadG-related protein [Streptomyces lydicus]|uniref:pilus assembly protein TadG-related protein n=1 Tax=Streptomyces lydicus TaxID=47763 RepID=UPI001012194F|nr:pilus assembly protein TadG-related protein [Streptomyces lydicus]MCZ1007730.1 pilus assembly protein TadG-related protein [Streptomyces lydicus]